MAQSPVEALPTGDTAPVARAAERAAGARHPLVAFIARRIAAGCVLFVIASALIFAATSVLPGDAAYAILGRGADPQALAAVRDELGLDRPAVERYGDWLGGFVQGDLGQSLTAQQSVSSLIDERIVNTAILALATLLVMLPLALILGVLAGSRVGRPTDHVISLGSLAAIALPDFVVGTVLVFLFAVTMKLFPPVSLVETGSTALADPSVLVLPVATLVVVGVAYMVRMLRAGMSEVMASEYIEAARLNGIDERSVIFGHALRNALAPTVQVVALTLQWLLGGIFVVETVFGYPGIGQGLVEAVVARDIPTVQSVAMLIAIAYITINIVADVLVVLLIPKLRTAR
jgi:peptide/nickel transport system permease protein